MYVHIIRSGSRNQYEKRLLRAGKRRAGKVVNFTVANVSGWTADQLDELYAALEAHREAKRHARDDDAGLLSVLLRYGVAPWRIMQDCIGLG